MTRVALISANLGRYEHPTDWPDQIAPRGVTVDVHRFDDTTLPPRPLAMTSRLQVGIPKWFGWQLCPGYDVYIWCDASCTPAPTMSAWFLDQLVHGDETRHMAFRADIAVFQHPERRSIRAEYEFMTTRMARRGERYLTERYHGEWLREEYEHIAADRYCDDRLYASTAFVYRPTPSVIQAFTMTWMAKCRWLLHDQLYFPYALAQAGCIVNVIPQNYLKCAALTFTRHQTRR